MPNRVVLVGHCNIDGPRLKQEIESKAAPCEVLRINTLKDLESACGEGAALLLVNREPVGFKEEGVDLIRDVCKRFPGQKVMLVSDYPEAQEEAVNAGALPGFGKQDMGSSKLVETVKQALPPESGVLKQT